MSKNVYVAGASSRARTTKEYLEYLYPDIRVCSYVVSPGMTDNDDMTDGIPVMSITADAGLDTSAKVYLGMRGVNFAKLTKELTDIGFLPENVIPVSVELDTSLRNRYVRGKFEEAGRSFVKIDELGAALENGDATADACIYTASSVFDGKLSDPYEPLKEEKILQVGAALTADRLFSGVTTDDTGENISDMNRQFCELTGLYWIWKNAPEDIAGLVHYRRHFLLPPGWMGAFASGEADVIFPVPLYVAPSLEENYRERHDPADWDIMMGYLEEYHPEERDTAKRFFAGGLYSPCNMLIARKAVLDDLCGFLFPVIFAAAEKIGTHDDKYQNRYPGFMSERLISYFFESRRDRYRIVYADKNFLN